MTPGLNSEESKVCEMLNINPHAYIETREQDRVAALNREKPMSEKDEIAFCLMMGIDLEEFRKQKAMGLQMNRTGSNTTAMAKNTGIAMGQIFTKLY